MKNGKTEHFWRIHARVARRLLGDLSARVQDAIAIPDSSEGEWFNTKVLADATRLYEDPAYYDNAEHTFRIPKHEQAIPRTA